MSEPPIVPKLLDTAVTALGGSKRDGQVRMAAAVAHSLDTGEHLAVQAGTGTGKSLAYLVPAVEHAQRVGKPAVVATATLALQGQIVDRDMPRLADALTPVAQAADVALAADLFWYMSGWATKITGGTVTPSVPYLPGAEFHAYTLREPVGVCAQVAPWNYPMMVAVDFGSLRQVGSKPKGLILTVAVNMVVDWVLHVSSGLKD